ncbi:MAG: restriction endonuclease subunit S [Clostridium sp.]|nr:restriction endonuclease subunit S [Clostridium sp.]
MEQKRLGDLATYINGYAFKPEDRGKEGLPIIRIQDLTGNTYDLGFYNGDYPEKIEINDGDILISWSASLGVYIWNRGKALLNQHIFKVVFDKEEVNKQYFVFAVKYNLKEMGTKAHGATMKHIVKKDFDNTLVPFPTIEKQDVIAEILSKAAYIVDARKQELQKLDDLVRARFVEFFGDPVANDKGWDTEICRNLMSKIGSGATPKGGKESYCDEGISLIRSMNVYNNRFEYKDLAHITDEQAEQLNNVTIEKKDILLNITGASVARCCIVPDDLLPARVNQHVSILRCKERVLPDFVCNMFTEHNYQGLLWNVATAGGATREAITKQQIEELILIIPPIDLQKQFVAFVAQTNKSKFTKTFRPL